jgi:hypothetical protein
LNTDEAYENPRLRALLLASRNHMDWMWQLADRAGGQQRARVEQVLKLIGAIDYALGIEPYTLDMDMEGDGASAGGDGELRPLDVGGGED